MGEQTKRTPCTACTPDWRNSTRIFLRSRRVGRAGTSQTRARQRASGVANSCGSRRLQRLLCCWCNLLRQGWPRRWDRSVQSGWVCSRSPRSRIIILRAHLQNFTMVILHLQVKVLSYLVLFL
jgi:hypothetical protein